ncbi:MAG: amidohydrolase [Solirubrobacterales bacterium]|nr:amidohydrolase [Solirubrobacterales bacterium]HRV60426.1 amidohydrolase [Solirubrobacterales bacterium]
MSGTIVRGAWALTMGPGGAIREGAVAFDGDGRITAVGKAVELAAADPGATVVGDGNGIVLPGFVNAHTHLTEGLITGMGETAVLWEWFERVVNPSGINITRDQVELGTRLKAVEMLESGITTVNDMCCHRNIGSLASLGAVDGLSAMGMRGVVCFGAEDMYDGAPAADEFMAEHEALADRISSEDMIDFRIGVGTVLGMSDELFKRTIEAAAANDWAIHTHLAEVREEITESTLLHGGSTIQHADRAGMLDHEVIAGHCIWCSENDIGLLASSDVAVAHNPVANMILASGVCPVPRLLREGIRIGIGTDGAASNDSQDMFGAIKSAALLQKVHHLQAVSMTAPQVMEMATIGGAKALGMEHEIGSLEPGKRADVVLLDGNGPELAVLHDPFQQIVYGATPRSVSEVWVDGELRVTGAQTVGVDRSALAAEARESARDLAIRGDMKGESAYAGPLDFEEGK